jgi:hypothetical protein
MLYKSHMESIQRRRLALLVIGLIALFSLVGVFQREARRLYYEWRLGSGDDTVQWNAARALEGLGVEAAREWYLHTLRTLPGRNYKARMRAASRLQMVGVLPSAPCGDSLLPIYNTNARLLGDVISIDSASLYFTLPADMAEWHRDVGSGIHLGSKALAAVQTAEGEWDTEFSLIVNSAVSFKHCMVHCGDDGWGAQAAAFKDLQMRLYTLPVTTENIYTCLLEQSRAAALGIVGDRMALTEHVVRKWKILRIAYRASYGDYGGTAVIEFWKKGAQGMDIICAFMYVDDGFTATKIEQIVESIQAPGL